MTYYLGVDLGTTFTAAAVWQDERARIVELGSRSAVVPSLVFLTDGEDILTGDAAGRRGATDPERLAREFKRRFGDTTPMLLGGSPYSADTLMARLLRWVVDTVSERQGGPPLGVAVTHPANWGSYKRDLLDQAIRNADLTTAITVTEPVAAVVHFATQSRVETGSVIAVYDLGGGTFDAAVVRKTSESDFEILGEPEGIERLGGVDFDQAVFAHVAAAVGGSLEELDAEDSIVQQSVARLREECVAAKEALSSDTDVSIPVLLPNLSTEVRLTRAEFEAMIRPPLQDSINALQRALRGAGVSPDQLAAVLLAGGSSRIPLVAQLVGAELGRPVAVDAHPKHGVAMGAARWAAHVQDPAAPVVAAAPVPPEVPAV
ncbi:MAG: Hsp70 family protein, partial [Acidimicrobiales bacterium]